MAPTYAVPGWLCTTTSVKWSAQIEQASQKAEK